MAANKRVGTEKGRSTSETTRSLLNRYTTQESRYEGMGMPPSEQEKQQEIMDQLKKRSNKQKDVNSHKWKGQM